MPDVESGGGVDGRSWENCCAKRFSWKFMKLGSKIRQNAAPAGNFFSTWVLK
jgi:hypothetical protein